MYIIVTGAAGFIGSHVCEYFIKSGNTVIGIDNFDPYYPILLKEQNLVHLKKSRKFIFYEADIRDREYMDKIFSDHPIDLVIHLAAKAGVRSSIQLAPEYFDVNVNGTVSILESMVTHDVKKLLFASSSSVYGNNSKVPFSESDPVDNPISPYAASKRSGELLCKVYNHLYGFDITCLRFFTVYGPRQRPDLAIHKFTKLIDEGHPIPIYGDGNTSRDYTYVEDIVDGINCAMENLGGFHIYNLAESKVISLNEMIRVIEDTLGKKAILKRLPQQPGDVKTTYADITKAKEEIGYKPKFNFEEGIKVFIGWYEHKKEILSHG